MSKLRIARALCALFMAAEAVPAQQPSFEDLARRAGAVLDSNPPEAAELFKQALVLRSDWPEGWMYFGACLYQLDRYAEATHAFRKGIELQPKVGTAWAFLGLAEAELDNADQALADIRKGEELGLSGNWQFEVAVRTKAAQLLIRSADFGEALAQLQPIALHNENSQAVVDTMGLCALGIPASLSELSKERRAVAAQAGKAAWALANQHPADAISAYRELMQQYSGEPGVHYAYGLFLMETDLSAALAAFEQEVKNNSTHWPALIVIASLQIRQGDAEAALKSLGDAMRLIPPKHRWLGHAELGQAYMTADNVPAAIAEFETAVRLRPSSAPMHFLLSQACRRAGRTADAARETAEFQKLKLQDDPLGVPGLLPAGKK